MKPKTLLCLWWLWVLGLVVANLSTAQMVYTPPATAAASAAELTNFYFNGSSTPISSATGTNSYAWLTSGPLLLRCLAVTTNGIPYLTLGYPPYTNTQSTISGSPYVGSTLTGAAGTLGGAFPETVTTNYSWSADGTEISGATGATYTLTSSELGKVMRFAAVCANTWGAATNVSEATAAVAVVQYRSIEDAQGPSTVAGGESYVIGDVLTVVDGTFTEVCKLYVIDVDGGTGAITGIGCGESLEATTSGVYSATPTNPVSVTGGNGSGATFNLSWEQIP